MTALGHKCVDWECCKKVLADIGCSHRRLGDLETLYQRWAPAAEAVGQIDHISLTSRQNRCLNPFPQPTEFPSSFISNFFLGPTMLYSSVLTVAGVAKMTSPLASWLTTFHQTASEHLTLAKIIRKDRVSVSYPSNFWYFRRWVLVWVVAAAAAAVAAEEGVVGAAELHWEARSSLVRVSGQECKGLPHPGIRTTKCFRVCHLVHPWTPFLLFCANK